MRSDPQQLVGAIDVSHTSHTTSNTGIQRVARNLSRELRRYVADLDLLTFDLFQSRWRSLNSKEMNCLHPTGQVRPSSRRRPRWTGRQKLFGLFQRYRVDWFQKRPRVDFVLFPEIYSEKVQAEMARIRSSSSAACYAIFHDAIAWKFPEWATSKTAIRYPNYMDSLLDMDGVIAVSEASLADLESFWRSRGVSESSWPRRTVVYLGADNSNEAVRQVRGKRPIVTCVATLEPRKNHLALLSGAAYLWEEGHDFELRLVGGLRREDGEEIVDAIGRFQERGYPLRWDGVVSDQEVEQAYAEADFVAYPSLYEGYGLPVIEAMVHGKPVLTTPCGSLSEVVAAGGCHVLRDTSASAIADGLREMLTDSALRARLGEEVVQRKLRTWEACAADIIDFIGGAEN
ncbi:MAG: glycosyltransferase family 4 protein [Opitutales bacterium]|nr:glycosyltransferase family 4 protein [Opitutales bacterium]NRA26558.1 glycosyltransferase family 4 protein [Opitutales bacterium]